MSNALIALGLAAVLAVAADAGAAAEAESAQAPPQGVDVARGDEWIYQSQDSLTGSALTNMDVVVVEKRADRIDARIRISDPNTGIVRTTAAVYDPFWRKMPDDIGPGDGLQESWGVRPQLRVGDDWSYSFERQLMGGPIMMRWIGHGEALGIEHVELANGRSVDAMKIEFFERPSVARYRFEMRVVEWFAPDINRYIRREVETRVGGELTESTTDILQDYVRRH